MYFKLFSDIALTKGIRRDCLQDLSRNKIILINKSTGALLSKAHILTKGLSKYKKQFLNSLVLDNFGFYLDKNEIKQFPEISKEFDFPSTISNAIIDIEYGTSLNLFIKTIRELEKVKCHYIEIRFISSLEPSFVNSIFEVAENHGILGITITLNYQHDKTKLILRALFKFNYLITKINIFGISKEESVELKLGSIKTTCFNEVFYPELCGAISKNSFTINSQFYFESTGFNTCLHRKIGIDKDGNIRNCPNMIRKFGNIRNTSLIEVVQKSNFQKVGKITKDKIETCKNCEFRNICLDCRAYIENPNDIYSKPLKCGYNPSTLKWENWSTNPLKFDSMKYYGFKK